MRYRHYSAESGVHTYHLIDYTEDQKPHFKPRGFWISDDTDYGWAKWCRDNDFNPERLHYKYSVKLAESPKILYIRTNLELDEFTKKYRDERPGGVNQSIKDIGPKFGLPSDTMEIDWPAVAKEYDGIVITPYQWNRRLASSCSWYYAWDCASGCIWNPRAIEVIKKLANRRKAIA